MIIEVNTDVIRSTINSTDNLIREFSQLNNTFKNAVASVSDSWKGTDYDYFYKKISTLISSISSLISYLESYNQFLNGYIKAHMSLNDSYVGKKISLK